MGKIRIASFNAENLFARAKVFGYKDPSTGTSKLSQIGELDAELSREVYDKPKIIALYEQVKDFITFNIMRCDTGSYVIRKDKGEYKVYPDGCADWFGSIQLKRQPFDDVTQKNIARVIRDVKADVLCLVEVENRDVLRWFNTDRLSSRYKYNILIDGNDQRGIDVAVYSNHPITNLRTHIFDRVGNSKVFSRDCLEVELDLGLARPLNLLVNHFKSKFGNDQVANDKRRASQTKRVVEILRDGYNLKRDWVVVAGDLNDTPDRPPLRDLLTYPDLSDVLERQFPDPGDRWTYHYRSNEQIDYVLVSKALLQHFAQAGVERRGIAKVDKYSQGKIKPYSTVTYWRNAASDHGAVWADFDLPD